jgi:hypothetical protein
VNFGNADPAARNYFSFNYQIQGRAKVVSQEEEDKLARAAGQPTDAEREAKEAEQAAKFRQEHPLGTPSRVFSETQIQYMQRQGGLSKEQIDCFDVEHKSPKECLGVD